MPVNTLQLKRAVLAQLGAEGTQRYTDARDLIPGMNGAQREICAIAAPLLAERKASEELFRELFLDRVFQTNALGGITLTAAELGHEVWTIIAVYAEIPTRPSPCPTIVCPADESRWVKNAVYRIGGKRVRRQTKEQAAMAYTNPFMAGSEQGANDPLADYAYYVAYDRSSAAAGWEPGSWELVVTPESRLNKQPVGISYLKVPTPIAVIDANTNLPFPESIINLLRDWTLHEMSIKQGDRTTLYAATRQAIMNLLPAQT